MSSASTSSVSTRPRVPDTVRIVYWPLRHGGLGVWALALVVLGLTLLAALAAENPAMGAVCGAALLLASWRCWLPVTFELGTKGVIQSTLVFRWRVRWRCLARYEKRGHGVWLLPTHAPSAWSLLRGIHVPFNGHEQEVLAVLDFFLAPHRPRAAVSTRTFVS